MRDLGLPLAQALMEALWIAALVTALGAFLSMPRNLDLTTVAGLLVAASAVGVLAERMSVRMPWRRLLPLPAVALLVVGWLHLVMAPGAPRGTRPFFDVLTVPTSGDAGVHGPTVIAVWLLALYLSGRGLMLGMQVSDPARVRRAFMRGAATLLASFALLQLASLPLTPASTSTLRSLVLSYFVLGLLVIASATRAALGRSLAVAMPVSLSLSWIVATLLPITAVVVVALLLSTGGDALKVLMQSVIAALGWLASCVALALTWAAYALVAFLRWFATDSPHAHAPARRHDGSAEPPPDAADLPMRVLPSVSQTDVLPYLVVAIVVLGGWLFVGLLLRSESVREPLAVEQRSSLWSWRLLRQQLASLLRGARAQAQRRGEALLAQGPRRSSRPPQLADIRDVYRALLRWAELRGHPRRPETTPLELAAQLARALPEAEPRVAQVTAHYVAARYGERLPSADELACARQHVLHLLHADCERADQPDA